MRPDKRLVVSLSVLSGLVAPFRTAQAHPSAMPAEPSVVLQVPYVAQSELLCGGAAVVMVERWWGRRGVYAEEFAHLVRPASGGILTSELVLATQARGWRTQAIRGTPALVQESLRDSVPVVALIQVAPDRYHYVVIVGWSDERVVFHDPAVAPFATLKVSEFLRRWIGADQWALLVRPLPTVATPAPRSADETPAPGESLPCRPWLDDAAGAAARNRLDDADLLLASAAAACPSEPLLLRELAGVRFRQGRQADATRLAREYLRRFPADTLAWQLLASSRYLAGDTDGALEAWNTIGRPTTDLVRIDGTRRIRFRALADALAIPLGATLTPARLTLAQRRLADIPALALANVTYAAVTGGVVEVRAAVVERPVLEPIARWLIAGVVGVAVRREVGFTVATPLGAGERWTAQWRWEAAHPRRVIRLDIPARIGLPGIVSLEGSWEQYRFADNTLMDPLPLEQRRATTLGFSGWLRGGVEALAGVRFERWSGQRDFLAVSLGGALHPRHDRLVLIVRGEQAVAFRDRASYARVQTRVAWQPPVGPSSISWTARLGVDWASAHAPRGLWPIAGGDLARAIPLRAQSLSVAGLLPTARSGQGILHGGVAADRPVTTLGPLSVAVGVFLDGADVMAAGDGSIRHRRYLDGGTGLRFGLVGAERGALRVDFARGLLEKRRWALSIGLEQAWPPRLLGIQ